MELPTKMVGSDPKIYFKKLHIGLDVDTTPQDARTYCRKRSPVSFGFSVRGKTANSENIIGNLLEVLGVSPTQFLLRETFQQSPLGQ